MWVAIAASFVALAVEAPPVQAAFPGQNGKIVFGEQGSQIVNPDGTGLHYHALCSDNAAWSPAGNKLVCDNGAGTLVTVDPDGSNEQVVFDWGSGFFGTDWAPDAESVVTAPFCVSQFCDYPDFPDIWALGLSGGGSCPSCGPAWDTFPAWSPRGDQVAFGSERDGNTEIYVANIDGSGQTRLTNHPGTDAFPDWSPDRSRIAFTREVSTGGSEIHTMRPDGSDVTQITDAPGSSFTAAWSPDGTKIAFQTNRSGDTELWVMGSDGSNPQFVVDSDNSVFIDWQPIPINAYPRPKGATPFLTYLVPAYAQCASPNRVHGPALSFASCNPPTQVSDELTVGSADSNGKPTKSISSVRFETVVGIPSTPADEADVAITAQITDVYTQAGLADYAGELRAATPLRITDKLNTPHPGGPGAGTVSDISYGFTIPCAVTADTTIGGACLLSTSADALAPGAVKEGRRAIWGLGAVEVYDANDAVFMKQGIFVP